MKKTLILSLILGLLVAIAPVSAAKPDVSEEAEPAAGTFDVPGRPDMKVRVFVHPAKDKAKPNTQGGKPTPPPPAPICYDESTDPDSTSVVGDTGWQLPNDETVNYRLNSASLPASVSGSLQGITNRAFAEWQNAIPGKVSFSQGTDTTATRSALDGQNIIAFGRISGSALGVTRVWYYIDGGDVAEVDMILNTKFVWTWTDQNLNPDGKQCTMTNSYDAQNVITHELGHWYGLDDEYDADLFGDNTMYGYASKAEVKKDTITTGDIARLQLIYP